MKFGTKTRTARFYKEMIAHEDVAVTNAMRKAEGVVIRAARILGINRTTLQEKLRARKYLKTSWKEYPCERGIYKEGEMQGNGYQKRDP